MIVQIKDVMLKELPEVPLVTLDKSPIPSDAQRIVAPGAGKKAPAKNAPKAAPAPGKAKGKAPAKKAPAKK